MALVFKFALELGLSSTVSLVAALLFGIHPMHVESVAWVTERKDVLYSVFYMLALLSYMKYTKTGKLAYFIWTIPLGLLSMLAKPMALSLPLVMLACDFFQEREMIRKVFLEKLVHLFYIMPLGWITYSLNARNPILDLSEGAILWIWTASFYIQKFLFPVTLTPVYLPPEPISILQLPYIMAIALVGLIVFCAVRFKTQRLFVFAVLFYSLSMFFLFRFDVYDVNFVADRFMYLPSVGICLWLGWLVTRAIKQYGKQTFVVLTVLFVLLGQKTYAQAKLWTNELDLWDHTVAHIPDHDMAYNGRGVVYQNLKQYDDALIDFQKALRIAERKGYPTDHTLSNIGLAFSFKEQYDLALAAFNQSIEQNPGQQDVYTHRAYVYEKLGKMDTAIDEYTQALIFKAQNRIDISDVYFNRGVLYHKQNDLDLALDDYNEAIALNPNMSADAYSNRAIIYFTQGDYTRALGDVDRALEIDPTFHQAIINREKVLKKIHTL